MGIREVIAIFWTINMPPGHQALNTVKLYKGIPVLDKMNYYKVIFDKYIKNI